MSGTGDGNGDRDEQVDFVEDATVGDGRDEELPRHPSRTSQWRPRLEQFLRGRYGLPTVVVVAVLALLIGRALLHDSRRDEPGSPRTPSSTPTGSAAGRAVTSLPLRTGPDPTRCLGLQCYTSSTAPNTVQAAVRSVFPQARFTATETIRLVDRRQGDPLWFRELDARVGSAALTVRVQAHAAGDTPSGDAKDDGHRSVTHVSARLRWWFVKAQTTDRSGTRETFDQLSTLVDDPRLLTV
ncbi:hypothetical protein [uncultured Jatrophihabitans sp.]|uniref:hypothetical protein n=1 Tax=uncultured Jatrophihabitans sp. TaxID=1610747 RepID=UPI0035CC9732